MAMIMDINAASVAPPSPAASPRSSPLTSFVAGRNLKVDNGTQPAHDHTHPLPAPLLDAWNKKHNQYSVPLMTLKDFKRLAMSVLRESGSSVATDDALEAALVVRMQRETHELTTQLERVKEIVFLQEDISDVVDDLLPYVQQETHHGWSQYIIYTLSVLRQLYSTQQSATIEPPPIPTPSPAPTQPQLQKQRATRIQKTDKQRRVASARRSDRIKKLIGKGAQVRRSDRIKKMTGKGAR